MTKGMNLLARRWIKCPDDGTCHHGQLCREACFRVTYCEPLSDVFVGDIWPECVKACPVCGAVLLYTCYHDGQDFSSIHMTAARAADLRENSGEYDPPSFECSDCGEDKTIEPGARIGSGYHCADCVREREEGR